MKNFNKKIVVILLVFALLSTSFSPFFARKAEAQYVDIVQQLKELGLDTIAWMIVNSILNRMAGGAVNWANTGFEGEPAYVIDPESYEQEIGDAVAEDYIFKNPNLDLLCEPTRVRIRQALLNNYLYQTQRGYNWQCTDSNIPAFINNWDAGGWNTFLELALNEQNSGIGALLQADQEFDYYVDLRQEARKEEVSQGQGFKSYKVCKPIPEGYTGVVHPGQTEICETVTPGDVISDQVNDQIGVGTEKLVEADEVNEIVSGLLNQLLNQVFTSEGLRGAGGLTEQLLETTEETITDYFDKPIEDPELPETPETPSDDDPVPVQIIEPEE